MTTTGQSSKPRNPKLPGQLAFIKGKFTQLVYAISSLQDRLPLTESIGILEMVQMQLTVEPLPASDQCP
ncbi:Hypothetical protein FKW44_000928 [Caligus rogercresseyi]|uniref:Uncharacterized protein n=1 Tax=Caligus rogercresseyi TaxID=217165 RepID=A0A7T8QV91_CALRO|nr:Hypothetical protein FKW44_000928 [Caligus rogercresseyi]